MTLLLRARYSLVALLLISTLAFSAVTSPVTILHRVADQMVNALEKNKAQLKKSDAVIYRIVNQILMPNIDVNRMSAAVVGRNYWMGASAAQKRTFVKEFSKLVTSTYASALASYDDDKVQFYPLRSNYQTSRTERVKSMIIRKNGQRISINYNVVRSGSSWKVYDFSIDNISMVQSYRSQFAGILASSGMDGLLKRLQAHNRQS